MLLLLLQQFQTDLYTEGKYTGPLGRIRKEGNCLLINFIFFTLLNGCPLTAKETGEENQKGAKRKLCMGSKYGHISQSLWAGMARGLHSLSSSSTGWAIQHTSLFIYQIPPAKWNGINTLFWKVFRDLLVKNKNKPAQKSTTPKPPYPLQKINSPSCKVNFFIWVSWE